MSYPPPYIFEPVDGVQHTYTIILLHGRSSTAEEFATDLFSLKTSGTAENLRSRFPGLRWVFPNAGLRWCTPFKEERSAWFDTFSLDDLSKRQDLQVSGLRDGTRLVRGIVEKEVERLNGDAGRIILGGFSQGSATALWSTFTGSVMTKGSLGAFVGLSAWMPFTNEAKEAMKSEFPNERIDDLRELSSNIIGVENLVSAEAMQACLQIPVYFGHGTDDALINPRNCYDLSDIFRALGASVERRLYVGAEREGHWIKAPEQVDEIVKFLVRVTVEN